MTLGRKQLIESLKGHLALLEKVSPKKAASPVARRTHRYVRSALRACGKQSRFLALGY
jgi:hypothetical protein